MKNRNLSIIGAIIVLVIVAPLAWYLASPLFLDKKVDEAFPFTPIATPETMPKATETEAMPEATAMNSMEESTPMMEATAMDSMEEATPATAVWTQVAQGQFQDADSFHQGSGSATIYQQDNSRVLRLENFEATNGPDLYVVLSPNSDPTGPADIGQYLQLDALKGNIGDQNYDLPADIDLSTYHSVVIYCVQFQVVFAHAPLTAVAAP